MAPNISTGEPVKLTLTIDPLVYLGLAALASVANMSLDSFISGELYEVVYPTRERRGPKSR